MSVLRRLLGETVVYALTPLLSSLVGLLLVPIYTRTFSPSDYGALAQINTTTTLAAILVVFGLDNSSAVWFWEHPQPRERSRTWTTWLAFTLAVAGAIALVAIALRKPLARTFLKDEGLASMWVLFAANLVAAAIPRIGILWFRMQRSPWPAVMLGAVTSVGTAVFGILFVVKMKIGLPGIIGGQAMGSWLGAIAVLIALRKVFSARAIDTARLGPMLRLSAPLVLMTNLSWVMGSAVNYAVNFLCSREDAGLYQVASSLAGVLGLVIFAFDQAWAPFALSLREVDVARRVYGIGVEAAAVLGLLLAYAAAAFAQPILLVVTHPQYVAGQWVLALLALNTVLINIPSILSVTFAREKMTMPLAKATAAGALVTVVLVPIGAKTVGKEGAAAAVVVGSAIILVQAFRSSQRVFRIDLRLSRIGGALVLTLIAAAVFVVTRGWASSLGAMIGLRTALVVAFAAALGMLYRQPLRDAWNEARTARASTDRA